MKIPIALFAIALLAPCMATADGIGTEPESWKRLVAEMKVLYGDPPALAKEMTKKGVRIELCPDNTCLGIVAPRNAPPEVVADFFYLFEFYAAPYYEQEREWKPKKEVSAYAFELLAKYREQAKCKESSETEIAHCILSHLVKTRGIKIRVIRDDEGHRVASPAQIDEFFQDPKK